MEDTNIKHYLTTSTYMISEFVLFPVTSMLTRVQSVYINRNVNQQRMSSFHGIGHLPFLVPGFLFRLKLSSTLDPYLQTKYSLSQVATFSIVSSLSDFINVFLKTPSEHYKQQFQSGNYTSLSKFLKEYYGNGGFSLFWKGSSVFLLRDVLFNITRFALLEDFQHNYQRNSKRRVTYEEDFNRLSPLGQKKAMIQNFQIYTWCNIMATVPAAVLTTPLDVVKTRVMTQPSFSPEGAWRVMKDIIKEEGWSALFRGAGLRCFYVCGMISISTSLSFYLNMNLDDAKRVRRLSELGGNNYD